MPRKIAVYPGSFDPITNGHLDIVRRGLKLFDRVVVAILINPKKQFLFPLEDRLDMLRTCMQDFAGVEVDAFNGLLVDYAARRGAHAILRGLRALSDFEYEFQMALMNRSLAPDIETFFMMPSVRYSFLSSNLVREVAGLGGSVGDLVPKSVARRLRTRFDRPQKNPIP